MAAFGCALASAGYHALALRISKDGFAKIISLILYQSFSFAY